MIQSMTGYGVAQSSHDGWVVSVECRTVNHKGFDARANVPRGMNWVEPLVLDVCKPHIKRGRLDIRVEVSREQGGSSKRIDSAVFQEVVEELRAYAHKHSMLDPTIADVLGFRDVLSSDEGGELSPDFCRTLAKQAISSLVASRKEEGAKLLPTLINLVEQIESEFEVIESSRDEILQEYREKLMARIEEGLKTLSAEIDSGRLAQELIIFADRSDVAEEIQRALSHCSKLRELLSADDGEPCGKRMDFYLQELMREANTTGSKSAALRITDAVVRIKTCIEQLREQSSNIE